MMSCNLRDSTVVLVWLLIHAIYSFKLNWSYANNSTSVLCLESERDALLGFKEHLIDPSNSLMSWNASQPDCCNWPYIVCDDFTGHVKELQLPYNKLGGSIPETLGTLSNLEYLDISDNMLEGIVSEAHFRNLTKLTDLRASYNNLTLKLHSNWVPPFQLNGLHLSHWSIAPSFPLWLQTQRHLHELDLSCTGISDHFPSWFPSFYSQLRYLNLSDNKINGELLGAEPQYQFNPENLFSLDLSNNIFSGSMSVFLCNPMSQVNELRFLNLGGNNLSGEIPDCWNHWQNLEVIILQNNHLTGNIPDSISQLNYLQSLHLRNNNLFGEIPASLQNCSMLITLDLGFNYFGGKLPAWLGSLVNLLVLALPANNLEGNISSQFCHLSFLQVLDISGNTLSGSIPACVNNLTAMASVKNLCGYECIEFPDFIDNIYMVAKGRGDQYDTILGLLTAIDISGNKLSGYIPKEITALLELRYLNVSGNELFGDIPVNIGDMQVLESFDLSRNKISGRIPPSMSSMHFLSYLNLSYNNLSGEIPLSTQLQSLDSWSFVGNKLCGPPLTVNCSVDVIPPEVGKESRYERGGSKVEGIHVAMVIGFVVGFWGICGPLLYSRPWRISYYTFLNTVWCRFCELLSK